MLYVPRRENVESSLVLVLLVEYPWLVWTELREEDIIGGGGDQRQGRIEEEVLMFIGCLLFKDIAQEEISWTGYLKKIWKNIISILEVWNKIYIVHCTLF